MPGGESSKTLKKRRIVPEGERGRESGCERLRRQEELFVCTARISMATSM